MDGGRHPTNVIDERDLTMANRTDTDTHTERSGATSHRSIGDGDGPNWLMWLVIAVVAIALIIGALFWADVFDADVDSGNIDVELPDAEFDADIPDVDVNPGDVDVDVDPGSVDVEDPDAEAELNE